MSKFVELPNGLVLDTVDIEFMAQSGLNEYHVFFKRPMPVTPKLDRANFESLRNFLGAQKLELPPEAKDAKPALIASA